MQMKHIKILLLKFNTLIQSMHSTTCIIIEYISNLINKMEYTLTM